jgi:hypothetical protein
MTKSIWIVLLLALIPVLSFAQTEEGGRVQVYSVTGVGRASGDNAQLQIGGGVDALIYKGIGVGGEFVRNKERENLELGLNIFSTNGSFHFLGGGASDKFDPFATGGYSRLFGPGAGVNALNFGGGFNYWLTNKVGVRFEFRDHVFSAGNTTSNLYGLRGGVAFGF